MTVTIHKMSAGKGYEYLLRTVAAVDGDRSFSTPLTRYYTEASTPPGRWMGSGLPGLGCSILAGDEVTEDQRKNLIGQGAHPVTGEPLGRGYRTFGPLEVGKRRHAVAGYDLTFSIPKSASVLWGVADARTQALIAQAHHAAIADAMAFLEREVIATRVGARGPQGAVAQVEVAGVVATGFDHPRQSRPAPKCCGSATGHNSRPSKLGERSRCSSRPATSPATRPRAGPKMTSK